MAKIYAKASRVIVWLVDPPKEAPDKGDPAADDQVDNGDPALEAIRAAAEERRVDSTMNQKIILTLLEREWFQRIWVLEEVAAARHILIKSGFTEIDGYAFCKGLNVLKPFGMRPDLQAMIPPIIYLIKGAVFRRRHDRNDNNQQARFSLNIRPLGELVDMYHTRQATIPLDKVYALLGMSSDDPGIEINYGSSWKDLFRELVNFSLSNPVSVSTWDVKDVSVMETNGYVFGEVSSARDDAIRDDTEHMETAGETAPSHSDAEGEQSSHSAIQASVKIIKKGGAVEVAVIEAKGYVLGEVSSAGEDVEITWKTAPAHSDAKVEHSSRFAFQASAKAIKEGDIVCLLQGASRPTIIRPCDGFLTIIRIAGPPTDRLPKWSHSITTFPTDLLLVWDWDESRRKLQAGESYEYFVSSRGVPRCPRTGCRCQDHLDKSARLWNLGVLLNGMERYKEAVKTFREAMVVYGIGAALRSVDSTSPGHGPWREVDKKVLGIMDSSFFKDRGAAMEAKYTEHGQTPLRWAVEEGHEAVVVELLAAGKSEIDAKDSDGRTPLSWAAGNGREAVVKRLVVTGKAEVDTKDGGGWTPLSWAVGNGHEAVVKLLVVTDKAEVDAKDNGGRTPLSWAAGNGYKAVVELLVETKKAEIDAKDNDGRTPLSWAAGNGYETVVERLVATGKAEVDTKDGGGWTPLSWAAGNGDEAVVKLLVATGKAKVDAKDNDGRTPLSWAAGNGHEAVVELLVATGKAEIDAKDNGGRTPLSWAAENGYKTVVELLVATGKAEVDAKDNGGRTPLSWAAGNGHVAVVELLATGKAEVDVKDDWGWTPLSWAAGNGYEAVVELLVATGKVEVGAKDRWGGTPLSRAAENGHKAVVEQLLATGKAEIDAKDISGQTPLSLAAENGHEAVVILLKAYRGQSS